MASVRTQLVASAISRRRFLSLSLGALAGAALATAAGCAQPDPAVSTKKVLVLGAGMSGLTAALALFRRGHEVTVIEYQNRVGGRLLSLPLEGGQFSEGGGGHFRANMPYLLDYVRRFDMSTVIMNSGLPHYIVDGKNAQADDLSAWPWPLADEDRGVGVSTTLNHYLHANGLDTERFLTRAGPTRKPFASSTVSP